MSRITQRGVLGTVVTGLALALTLTACSNGSAQDSATGGQSGSTTLHVYLANHSWTDSLVKRIPDYEKESGVKVEVTQLEQQQLEDQYAVKLNAGSTDIDVMMYRPQQVAKLYGESDYTTDLTPYIDASGDWDWEDFVPAMRQLVTYDGRILGVPIASETEVLFYRTDLLQAAGLEPPTTLDELQTEAAQLKSQNPGTAGFIARTTASGSVTMFSSFLYSYGANWFDDQGKSTIDSPEARQAYDMYGKLLREDGPDNVTTDMEWTDTLALFASGKSAFYAETSSDYPSIVDPKSSQVIGKVGVVPFPAGPQGSKPFFSAAYALGVNEFSKNKDQAWDFVKWATGKDMMAAFEKESSTGTRQSALQDADALSGMPQDLRDAFVATIATGQAYDRPPVVDVNRAREIVGTPIATAISGGDVDAALKQADADFQALLDSEKK